MNQSEVLVVEDSLGDIDLLEKSLQKFENNIHLQITRNGEKALDFLRKKGKNAQPDLILLDLNMPKMDGFEFLGKIRKDNQLNHLPVVVMTMSNADEDILKAYQSGANCCMYKPLGFKEFIKIMEAINNFWLNNIALPPKEIQSVSDVDI